MTEREFLDAIDDDPGADDTCLVYADWLEEQGENLRAELIRAELEDKYSRKTESLRTKCKASFPGFKQWERAFEVEWVRGLPCTISLKEKPPSDKVLRALPEFPWVSRLKVDKPPPADLVAALRERTRLHTLIVNRSWVGRKPGDKGVERIAGLAPWRGLVLMDVGLTDAGLEPLAPMRQLRVLSLGSNEKLTDAGIARLKDLRELRDLDLSYLDKLTGACLDFVVENPELRRLDLTGIEGVDDSNVGRLSELKHLRELDLAQTGVTRYRLLRLLKCPKLKRLHLMGARAIEDESAEIREVDAFVEEAEEAGILVDMDLE